MANVLYILLYNVNCPIGRNIQLLLLFFEYKLQWILLLTICWVSTDIEIVNQAKFKDNSIKSRFWANRDMPFPSLVSCWPAGCAASASRPCWARRSAGLTTTGTALVPWPHVWPLTPRKSKGWDSQPGGQQLPFVWLNSVTLGEHCQKRQIV